MPTSVQRRRNGRGRIGLQRVPPVAKTTGTPDLARIVAVLDRHRVKYLIVGGPGHPGLRCPNA
jgi:hypothetical protein